MLKLISCSVLTITGSLSIRFGLSLVFSSLPGLLDLRHARLHLIYSQREMIRFVFVAVSPVALLNFSNITKTKN